MAKNKNKTRSEVEHLRGIVREYEREIRSLQKQLRQYEKYERSQDEDYSTDSEDTEIDLKMTKPCDQCGKGTIIETLEILGKLYGTCNVCDYKTRMK